MNVCVHKQNLRSLRDIISYRVSCVIKKAPRVNLPQIFPFHTPQFKLLNGLLCRPSKKVRWLVRPIGSRVLLNFWSCLAEKALNNSVTCLVGGCPLCAGSNSHSNATCCPMPLKPDCAPSPATSQAAWSFAMVWIKPTAASVAPLNSRWDKQHPGVRHRRHSARAFNGGDYYGTLILMRADSFKFTYSTATRFAYENCVILSNSRIWSKTPQGHFKGKDRLFSDATLWVSLPPELN